MKLEINHRGKNCRKYKHMEVCNTVLLNIQEVTEKKNQEIKNTLKQMIMKT